MSNIQLIDPTVSFDEDHNSGKYDTLIIKHQQEIPDEFISSLKRDKINTLHTREGEFMHLCSIPVVIVEKWKREGFDINHATAKEILQRLSKESFDAFIATRKRIY